MTNDPSYMCEYRRKNRERIRLMKRARALESRIVQLEGDLRTSPVAWIERLYASSPQCVQQLREREPQLLERRRSWMEWASGEGLPMLRAELQQVRAQIDAHPPSGRTAAPLFREAM